MSYWKVKGFLKKNRGVVWALVVARTPLAAMRKSGFIDDPRFIRVGAFRPADSTVTRLISSGVYKKPHK